ncbi:MAG: HAMP domain-containing protein, partial [Gammaproteobacteria bacterium]|nr:HAMP domain-containing protein [Gammaproteobacteria bacterium]
MKLQIPIRYKLLLILLFVTTTVVSLITFTMSNLFHDDKKEYIHDLISMVAVHAAQETNALLTSYHERLNVFARIMADRDLERKSKVDYLQGLFGEFPELVSVLLIDSDSKQVTLFDSVTLEQAGLSEREMSAFRSWNPLPLQEIYQGKVYIKNSTISEKLPTFTLASAYALPDGEKVVVAGNIRINRMLDITRRSKVYNSFMLDSANNLLTHADPKLSQTSTNGPQIPDLDKIRKQHTVVMTREYAVDNVDLIGGFAQTAMGSALVVVQIPKSTAFLTARSLFTNLVGVTFILLLAAAVVSLIWARRITRPIEKLSQATREVGKGEFGIQVSIDANDEIGKLADSFNNMSSELRTREEKLQQANMALVQSEKMSAFGQLSAGIAHEVKNPLTGILGYAQLAIRQMDKDNPLLKNMQIIEKETRRCKSIIENLMKFARAEKAEFAPINVNSSVENALAIVNHQLGMHRISVVKNLAADLPDVLG